jgi:hypothetical protein
MRAQARALLRGPRSLIHTQTHTQATLLFFKPSLLNDEKL